MPSVSMPSVQAPKLNLPNIDVSAASSLRDFAAGVRDGDDPMDADELRASTAQTIARWRQSIGLRELAAGQEAPDRTLVDIVSGEREIEEHDAEPLAAVIDILRGAHRSPTAPN
jgi:hypothetical protein